MLVCPWRDSRAETSALWLLSVLWAFGSGLLCAYTIAHGQNWLVFSARVLFLNFFFISSDLFLFQPKLTVSLSILKRILLKTLGLVLTLLGFAPVDKDQILKYVCHQFSTPGSNKFDVDSPPENPVWCNSSRIVLRSYRLSRPLLGCIWVMFPWQP